MNLFQLREDERRRTGSIDIQRRWGLPGLFCDECGSTWGTVGLEYPTIDLSGFPGEPEYMDPSPVPLETYRDLEIRLKDFYPDLGTLKPGTEFGNGVGRAEGSLSGFVWGRWWTICLDSGSLDRMLDAGLSLPPVTRVDLGSKREGVDTILELELPLESYLVNGVYDGVQKAHCSACDRDSASLPERPLIGVDDVTGMTDIFRVRNFTTLVLVTEKFVDIVAALRIPGAVFEEIAAA